MRQVTKKTLNIGGQLLRLEKPLLMGILNVTPDSFYSGSRVYHKSAAEIVEKAGAMLEAGATFLDVGGYSTRPGAAEVPEEEEAARVVPLVGLLKKTFPAAVISVDTFRAPVAEAAVKAGAGLVNDVSGGTLDERMFNTVAALGVPYVLMHMRGTPATMNDLTAYDSPVAEIVRELQKKLAGLRELGVADVIVDPGLGFAKTTAQNFLLLRELAAFQWLECPVLVGVSRKSMVWKTLGVRAEEAVNGTTVLNTLALERGADILRVHDVREAAEAVKLVGMLHAEKPDNKW